MKKILILQFVILALISCKKDDNSTKNSSTNTTTANYSFSFKLDGVPYSWSGNHLANGPSTGQATWSGNSIALQKCTNSVCDVSIACSIPNLGINTYSFPVNSLSQFFTLTLNPNNQLQQYGTFGGGTLQMTVTSIDPNNLTSNPSSTSVGKIKGVFAGTITDINGGFHTISNGVFEAANCN